MVRSGLVAALVALLVTACTVTVGGQAPDVGRADEAAVYWVLAEPGEHPRYGGIHGTWLTRRVVDVEEGGDPAVAAVRALMTVDRPGPGLLNSPVASFRDPPYDVVSVTHDDGLVTVDFTGDFYDPCPACSIVLPTDTGTIVQQYVLTAQAAFDTDDPVLFTARGEPVRGLWFERLRGPVAGDRGLVVPPDGAGSPVDALDLATADRPAAPGGGEPVEGVLRVDETGCLGLDLGDGVRPVVWPRGWTAWRTPPGSVLLDDDGLVVGRVGRRVRLDAGPAAPGEASPCLPAGARARAIAGVTGPT